MFGSDTVRPPQKNGLIRIIAGFLAIISGFIFLTEPKKGLINWHQYDAQVITSAQRNQKPVLIKFTADWCFSCKILDKTVYSSTKIADLIKQKGVLAIKADTTRFDYPAAVALKEIYNEPAVPVTVLLLPGNDPPVKLRGNLIKNELIKNLQSLKDDGEISGRQAKSKRAGKSNLADIEEDLPAGQMRT